MSVIVVVTGSTSDDRFAVTNFSVPAAATTVFITPPFRGGCVVDCSKNLAAVGNFQGGSVAIYDLTNPAAPVLQNTYDTGLGSAAGLTGIGALSLDGTNLLVGEYNGPHIVLLDISQPPATAIVSSISAGDFGDGGIYSIALSGPAAVASGQFTFDVLDYTKPTAPVVITYTPAAWNGNINFQGPIACDFDGATVALGDNSGNVYLFSPVLSEGILDYDGTYPASLPGITSIAVMTVTVTQVAAGSISYGFISLITAGSPTPPPVNLVPVGSGSGADPGGALGFFGFPNLVASTNNGSGIAYLNTLGWPTATALGVAAGANLAPTLRPSLGFTAFEPPATPKWPWPFPMLPSWLQKLLQRLWGWLHPG